MKIRIERKGIGACLILWVLLFVLAVNGTAQQEAPAIGPGPMGMSVTGLRRAREDRSEGPQGDASHLAKLLLPPTTSSQIDRGPDG
jgi:hypothetical protein